MGLVQVADSRDSDSDTIRVVINSESHEDFIGDDRHFYIAWVNEGVWTGPTKLMEEERYLYVYWYDSQQRDAENNFVKGKAALFPAKAYLYVRTL
jgi:hypothetical protein